MKYMKQREIKFRAWDRDTKMFINSRVPDWNITPDGRVMILNVTIPSYKIWDSVILMQYTGLHDKNGKEIYEGDIMETPTNIRFEIKWNDEMASFMLNGLEHMIMKLPDGVAFSNYRYSKIIGNIWEDKHLLDKRGG